VTSPPAGRGGAPAGAPGSSGGGRRLLGQILKAQGAVREGQIQEALAQQRKQGGLIGQCLVDSGHCSRRPPSSNSGARRPILPQRKSRQCNGDVLTRQATARFIRIL